jgi:hypothetical protein
MSTRRELYAFLLAPAATPFVFIVALFTAHPAAVASILALSILALLVVASYLAAFLVARPIFSWLRHRVRSIAIQCILAGAVAGLITGIVVALLLILTGLVTPNGNSGALGALEFFVTACGTLGLIASVPAVFTLYALLHSKSWDHMGPNPSLNADARRRACARASVAG